MALVNCKECGKQFSDSASKCPNCGAPSSQSIGISSARKTGGIISGFITIILGMIGIIWSATVEAPKVSTLFGFDRSYYDNWLRQIKTVQEWSFIIVVIGIGIIIFASRSKSK